MTYRNIYIYIYIYLFLQKLLNVMLISLHMFNLSNEGIKKFYSHGKSKSLIKSENSVLNSV